jgi:hypothetical protein
VGLQAVFTRRAAQAAASGRGLRPGAAHISERMLLNLHFLILIIFYDATADY